MKGISIAKQATLVLAVWFVITVFSSASGATLALRPPFPQVVLCGLLGLLFVAFGYLKAFRQGRIRNRITVHQRFHVGIALPLRLSTKANVNFLAAA